MPFIGRAWALLPALLVAGCVQKNEPDPIWVGHVAPLSGPARVRGEHARQAILLAVEEVNRDDHRVHGRRVIVVHADDRGNDEVVQAEAVRLLAVNRVSALLGGTDPSEAERLARAAQAATPPAPVVALSALPNLAGGEGVLSLAVGPSYQGTILGRFAAQELKPARVAVVSDGRPFSTNLATAFARVFPRDKVEESTYANEDEFAELVKRLRKAEPEAVLIAAPARDYLELATLLKGAGLQTSFLWGGPEGELPLVRADREASQGTYLATLYPVDGGTPANQAFVKRYQERYSEPPDLFAAMAYDGSRLLFDAMRRARTLDPVETRRELSQTETFDSLTGPITFKDLHAVRPVFVVRLEDGQLKQIKQYDPEGK